MDLSQKSCVLLLVVVAAVCTELYQAHDFLGRCSCPTTIKFIKGNMSDFQILEKQPGCDKTELIITMMRPDNTTQMFCMNMEGKMAQAFVKCWERINRNESRKMECIDRKRKVDHRTSDD